MIERGLPLLRKTQEIIKYFNPTWWYIENPATGKMKQFLTDLNHYDVDYCMYSDWGYKKRTRIWTNKMDFTPKLCNKACGNLTSVNGRLLHKNNLGNSHGNRLTKGSCGSINMRYRIPPQLIKDLIK